MLDEMERKRIHTFAICAYEVNPYLEECIKSVLSQSIGSNVIITTSTPNEYIEKMASRYNIKLFVNDKYKQGAIEDWNYAYQCAETELVTICHQDDFYCEKYTEILLKKYETSHDMLLFFTDYFEVRNGKRILNNKLLRIKRMMLSPFLLFKRNKFIRRLILAFGSPICCPAVSFCKLNLPPVIFDKEFQYIPDWAAWERISRLEGSFLYSSVPSVGHRIHEESWTTEVLQDNKRFQEELRMFEMFWPKLLAKKIAKVYQKSGNSNKISN